MQDLGPLTFAGTRFILAAVCLVAICGVWRLKFIPQKKDVWPLALSGFFIFTVNYALVFWGELHVSSGLASVLQASIPLSGMFFAHFMLQDEPLEKSKIIGALVATLGIAIICQRLLEVHGFFSLWGGVGIVVGGASMAFANVLLKQRKIKLPPAAVAAWQMILGLPPLLVLALILEGNPFAQHWTWQAALCIFYLAIIGSSLAFILLYWIMPRTTTTKLQTIALVTPPGAVLLGWLLAGEVLSPWAGVGAIFVMAGIWLIFYGAAFAKNSHKREEPARP